MKYRQTRQEGTEIGNGLKPAVVAVAESQALCSVSMPLA
jgi:hypothetical protein